MNQPTLRLFNPENDLALAAGSPNFTPPKAGMALGRAGAVLPAWWSRPGDCIMATEADMEWLKTSCGRFGIEVERYDAARQPDRVEPWGWSGYTRKLLLKAGVAPDLLPSEDDVEEIRRLSHRRLTVEMHDHLAGAALPYPMPPRPLETDDIGLIGRLIDGGKKIYVKSPWSSSGRGVLFSGEYSPRHYLEMTEGMMRHQGSVMVEAALDKLRDFAMLYDMKGGKAAYVGLSVFYNTGHSIYGGNMVASEERLGCELAKQIPEAWIELTATAVAAALEAAIGTRYEGPLGVDMMIHRLADGTVAIAPCVEVNVRTTMGRAACELHRLHFAGRDDLVLRIVKGAYSPTSNYLLRLTPPSDTFNIVIETIGDGDRDRGAAAP